MVLAGPALSQEAADLTSGPLRIALGQQRERSAKVDRGAVVAVAGAGESAVAPLLAEACLCIVGPGTRRSTA
eukprot:5059624-Alexandrium_andersonii.AAC.1